MATITFEFPDELTIPLAVRGNVNAGNVTLTPGVIPAAVAAEVFHYGLRQIIRDAAAAGTEKAYAAARARAEALNAGKHWRVRVASTQAATPDMWMKKAIQLAIPIVTRNMPSGVRKADWLKRPDVQERIRVIAERLRPQAEAILAAEILAMEAAQRANNEDEFEDEIEIEEEEDEDEE
jgi:hypothetical protein